ncbi:MAG: tRNA pseudouridine(55) synthase TruB [Devosia sp.]|uniref:tRNA pseudouridine(55) synthase TruB n=1 Tax=Devosia sp. TaxID=1871048 RepID=UPI001ACA05AA|nr:tRNA pseudouridine(55) synthase TruB [Devosia sp.]MBN9315921.1 tRNA pseudouridine(55) synthase TruB [Devosia sp.]
MSKPQSNKRDVSGWLVLDKPYDMTSTQAVGKVRWLFGAKKAGHAGTLDPLATGILPIALGEATKTVPAVQDGQKVYRFTIKWGEQTTTDDAEGEICARSEVRPDAAAITAALPAFTGEILQTPPAFSAIKIDGERAYDLARAGETVVLEPRPVFIEALRLVAHDGATSALEMTCEKGTYVRALARDLAHHLGSCAHVVKLHRAMVGPFGEAQAVTLAELEAAADRDSLLQPVTAGLLLLPEVRLTPDQASAVRNGNPVLLTGPRGPVALEAAWASCAGAAVALGCVEMGRFKPHRVIAG